MGREESQGLCWRRRKEREPKFLVEQESGIWLEVLIFGGEEFCGDLRRRESCLGGKSTHQGREGSLHHGQGGAMALAKKT